MKTLDAKQLSSTLATHQLAYELEGRGETAMFPLYCRYLETLRGDRILKDLSAVNMVRRLTYDFTQFKVSQTAQLANIIATRLFDYGVMHFLECTPNALILNLGAGLCSRFQRIDNGSVCWYDIDLPEVNQIRAEFFQPSDRYQWLSSSLLDEVWLDQIDYRAGQPVLILMEGVSMFLIEAEVKHLLSRLKQKFNPVEILMDVICVENLWHQKGCQHPAFDNSRLKWSLRESQSLEHWGFDLQILEENFYLTYLKSFVHRFQAWNQSLMALSMPVMKNANRLLRVGIRSRCPPQTSC